MADIEKSKQALERAFQKLGKKGIADIIAKVKAMNIGGTIENISNVNNERDVNNKIIIANLENELHFLNARLNRKISLKERLTGKISR